MKFRVWRVSDKPVIGEGVCEEIRQIIRVAFNRTDDVVIYTKEFNTIEELMAFSKEQGASCIIGDNKLPEEFGLPEILIYDDYIE